MSGHLEFRWAGHEDTRKFHEQHGFSFPAENTHVALVGGKVVGFATFHEDTLSHIRVLGQHQKSGIGGELLKRSLLAYFEKNPHVDKVNAVVWAERPQPKAEARTKEQVELERWYKERGGIPREPSKEVKGGRNFIFRKEDITAEA